MPVHPLRVLPLPPAEWTDEVRELIARIAPDGSPLNVFTTLARHPGLLKRWMVFATHVLRKNTLPPRERELLILRTGWLCQSEYEFHQHRRIGRAVGLTDDEIERIKKTPADWTGRDATLVRAADELVRNKRIGDSTWAALERDWSEPQRLDLIFTVGQYTLVSMVLNTLGVQIEEAQ